MKCVIAAAGRGTRMLHLSNNKPKHLIPISGKPWMAHIFDRVKAAGLNDIILVVGYQAEAWNEFIEHDTHDLHITVINQFETLGTERYGTSLAVECVEDAVGKEPFVFFYGDNVYSPDDFKLFLNDDAYHYIGGMYHDEPWRFGVLFEQDGYLKKIVEKPSEYIGNLINVGLYKFLPEVFDAVKKVEISPRGEYELTDAVSMLAKRGKVRVMPVSRYWMDFGRPEDVEKGAELLARKENI